MIFAEEGEPSLPGVITLEDALLAVDPSERRTDPGGGQEILTGASRPSIHPDGAVR